jgi:DNA-binding MarR family transcriptional regulator
LIPEILDGSLGFNIHRTALLFRRELARSLSDLALTPEQWHILALLNHARRPLPQSDLVRELLRDKPTVSRILQRMLRHGWVERRAATADARVALISLTASGQALARSAPRRIRSHFDKKLEFLSDEAVRRMVRDLKHVQEGLVEGAAPTDLRSTMRPTSSTKGAPPPADDSA